MAKFLQETLDNMSVCGKGHTSELAQEFADFFSKVYMILYVLNLYKFFQL